MRRERLPDGPDDRLVVAGIGVAALGPIVVASLLVLVRDHMARSNAALVFVIVVVLAAALGGRWAGVTAAVVSAMSYDFFLTRPYGSLKIDDGEDIVATVLLLAVGLIVGEVVVWAHRGHRQKKRGQDEITRLHRVAEQVAAGARAEEVLESVRVRVDRPSVAPRLHVRAAAVRTLRCRGSGATARSTSRAGGSYAASSRCPPRASRSRCSAGAGKWAGSCSSPTPDVGVSIEERVVAIAISDQLGAAVSAESDASQTNGERENDRFPS